MDYEVFLHTRLKVTDDGNWSSATWTEIKPEAGSPERQPGQESWDKREWGGQRRPLVQGLFY